MSQNSSSSQEESLLRGCSTGYDPHVQQAQPGNTASFPGTTTTKSGGMVKLIDCLLQAMSTEISDMTKTKIEGETFCLQAMHPDIDINSFKGFDEKPLLACKASADPDTMHMH